jgi:exonuclease SbcC
MIIKRIYCENFLKYANLDLDKLPEHGVIAVSGQNESGKTSIGESLCFALFGRTFTLDLQDPSKLIRWGESQCSVSVEFIGKDQKTYRVTRYLDSSGTYGAQLVRLDDDRVIAKGAKEVDVEITPIIGYGYNEFIESFYLAQRELTTPHPHSHTIKVMAGIAPLSKVAAELEVNMAKEKELLNNTHNDYSDTKKQLAELDIDTSWMPELKSSRTSIDATAQSKSQLTEGLDKNVLEYQENLPLLHKNVRQRRLTKALIALLLVLTGVLWNIWFLLHNPADSNLATALSHWFQAKISAWESYRPMMLPAAILSSLLFLGSLFRHAQLGTQIQQAKEKASHLTEQLDKVLDNITEKPAHQPDRIAALLRIGETKLRLETDQKPALQDSNLIKQTSDLLGKTRTLAASSQEAVKTAQKIREGLAFQKIQFDRALATLDTAMSEEQARLKQAEEIHKIKNDLNKKVRHQLDLIHVHETGVSLLDSAAHHLSHRFNQSILSHAGKALPLFTQNRYEHLKIDENLTIRVFSSTKHDFMDFEEISSGTQRQIMLSLRLAMSQELIRAIDGGKQFIFFDEPFAFFDQERIRQSLEALPKISDKITQIWLVAQEYPEGTKADVNIECSQDKENLTPTLT